MQGAGSVGLLQKSTLKINILITIFYQIFSFILFCEFVSYYNLMRIDSPGKLISLHPAKQFQVLLSNTNNS